MTTTSGRTLRRRLPVLAAAVAAVIVLHATNAAAGQLVEVTGEFAPDGADAAVTLEYVVTAGDAPVETIPVTGLHFGGATLAAIEATTADGQPMEVEVEEGARSTTAELVPPAPIQPGEELRFTLSYEAAQAVSARDDQTDVMEIPVLAVPWAPVESRSGVFTAELTLPEGYHFSEGFPSVPESVEEAGGTEVVSYDMIVMPALVRAVATSGSAPFLSYQRVLEIVAVVVIIASAVFLYVVTVSRRPGRLEPSIGQEGSS